MINFDVETTRLRDMVRAINPGLSAVFERASDPQSEDDQISVTLDGKPTGYGLQLGHGYVGIVLFVDHADPDQMEWWDFGEARTISGARAKLLPRLTTAFRPI